MSGYKDKLKNMDNYELLTAMYCLAVARGVKNPTEIEEQKMVDVQEEILKRMK